MYGLGFRMTGFGFRMTRYGFRMTGCGFRMTRYMVSEWLDNISEWPGYGFGYNILVTLVANPCFAWNVGGTQRSHCSGQSVCSDCSQTPPRIRSWTWSAVTAVGPPRIRSWTWSAVTAVGPPPKDQKLLNLVCSDWRGPYMTATFEF